MKIGEFRALAKEELPEAPWISKLLDPLNRFLSSVRAALANGLTFADNFNAEIRTLEITTRISTGLVSLSAARSATSQSFSAGINVVALYDTEHVDSHDAYDPSTGVFTVPAAGLYLVSASLSLMGTTAGTGIMILNIQKNGTAVARSQGGISGTIHSEEATALLSLAEGDAIRVAVYQSNGAARSSESVANVSRFSIVKLDGGAPSANGAFPVRWKSKVRGKLTGILVLRCVEVLDRSEKPVLAALGVDWAQDGENTIIRNVAGLTGGKTYRLTVAALGG
jgi:hypothetical protein